MHPFDDEPIHVAIPGRPDDPRNRPEPPDGVVIHYVPELHPDDLDEVNGIPVTSVARTLIDCAEVMEEAELRQLFQNAIRIGLFDPEKYAASRQRVEWRPSLELLDRVAAEFL